MFFPFNFSFNSFKSVTEHGWKKCPFSRELNQNFPPILLNFPPFLYVFLYFRGKISQQMSTVPGNQIPYFFQAWSPRMDRDATNFWFLIFRDKLSLIHFDVEHYTNNECLWVQWYKYFHEVKDEMFHSTRRSQVEWNISSFTEWKYLFHCTNEKTFIICFI